MRLINSFIGGILMYLSFVGTMLFMDVRLTEETFNLGAIGFFLLGVIVAAFMQKKTDYTKAGHLLLPTRIKDAVQENCRLGSTMTEADIVKAVRKQLNQRHETDTDSEIINAIKKTRGLVKLQGMNPPTYRNEIPN